MSPITTGNRTRWLPPSRSSRPPRCRLRKATPGAPSRLPSAATPTSLSNEGNCRRSGQPDDAPGRAGIEDEAFVLVVDVDDFEPRECVGAEVAVQAELRVSFGQFHSFDGRGGHFDRVNAPALDAQPLGRGCAL